MAKRTKMCAFCRCVGRDHDKDDQWVCRWHLRNHSYGPPCPACASADFRWTYTVTGELSPNKVAKRESRFPNTVFFDNTTELVLRVESVVEPAPLDWPRSKRLSVIMIGIGQQVGTNFVITQWASDWEKELMEQARPSLALASKIYVNRRGHDLDALVLAGQYVSAYELWNDRPRWPAVDIRSKVENVFPLIQAQKIPSQVEESGEHLGSNVTRLWDPKREPDIHTRAINRQSVWRHNYNRVLDTSMRIFQIERPQEVT